MIIQCYECKKEFDFQNEKKCQMYIMLKKGERTLVLDDTNAMKERLKTFQKVTSDSIDIYFCNQACKTRFCRSKFVGPNRYSISFPLDEFLKYS